MRAAGFDYFENSRRATIAQRDYAIANPGGWTGYSGDIWGLTACDGPGGMSRSPGRQIPRLCRARTHRPARRPRRRHDRADRGDRLAAVRARPGRAARRARCYDRYGGAIYGQYGFLDSFNPSFTATDVPIQHGRVTDQAGWVDGDYLGIDQGPIVAMIENHRSGLVWDRMRRSPAVRTGLQRAGFTGGWLG